MMSDADPPPDPDATLCMNMGDDDAKPSELRRRLSAKLLTSTDEAIAKSKFDSRRHQTQSPEASEEIQDCAAAAEQTTPTKRQSRRRASILTEIFAKSSCSASFREQTIRPTVILAMLFLRDPRPDVGTLRSVLGERLLQIPRFSSTFRLENGRVYCDPIDPGDVDLQHHIVHVDGRGTFGPDDVSDMISSATQEWWDASKPLWRISVVTNLADGRSLLLCKIDHAIGDGIAMLSVFRSLLDDPPDSVRHFQRKRVAPPSVSWSKRVPWFLYGVYEGMIGWAINPIDPENGLKIPKEATIGDMGSKTFTACKPYPLSMVHSIKNKLENCTVNDIIMAVVSIGIRRYFERTSDPILNKINAGKNLQAISMVNTRRGNGDGAGTTPQHHHGNDFATVNFRLPLRFTSEIDAVWQIKDTMDFFKVSPTLYLMKLFGIKLLESLPESALIQATMETIRKPSCIISNVMGPSFECTIAGYAVDDLNFLTSSVIGLYVGVISYNGTVRVSFTTDKLAKINGPILKRCFEEAFDDLNKAVADHPAERIKEPAASAKVMEYIVLPLCVAAAAVATYFVLSSDS